MQIITVLRSKRSAISIPSNGPNGAAIAMTLAYIKLVVTVMPCLINNVGIHISVRLRYGGINRSRNAARARTGSGNAGSGKGRPYSRSTRASSRFITASASSMRPFCASQRGLSGKRRRIHHTTIAPTTPKRHDRHRAETDSLRKGRCATTHVLRHELGDVRADRHDLHANANPRDEAPEVQPKRRVLERHDDVGRGVPEQRPGEDRAPPETVGEKTACRRANEQAGKQRRDETRHAARAEQTVRRRGQNAATHETRRDVAGEHQVIQLEEKPEAQQHHQLPDRARGGQAVEPRGNARTA
ncbi:hypothetical protein KCU90_g5619, partial [Aureobasidium melanogenum]